MSKFGFFCNNMNMKDRAGRFALGAGLIAVSPIGMGYLGNGIAGWFSILFGGANVISSIIGWCFMYSLVGLDSAKRDTDENSSDWKPLDFAELRRKAILGFVIVTAAIMGLFITETYFATKQYLTELYTDNGDPYVDVISGQLGNQLKEDSSEEELQGALRGILSQFHSSLLVVAEREALVVFESRGLDQTAVDQLMHDYKAQGLTGSSAAPLGKNLGSLSTDRYISHRFSRAAGREYIWSDLSFELGSRLIKLSIARPEILPRSVSRSLLEQLTASSALVVWLAVWAAVAVAYFVWRNVERSNHYAMLASVTDQETGLFNQRWLERELKKLDKANVSYVVLAASFRNLTKIAAASGFGEASRLMEKVGSKLIAQMGAECMVARLNSGAIVLIAPESSSKMLERFSRIINENQDVGDFSYTLAPTEVRLSFPDNVSSFNEMLVAISALLADANKRRVKTACYDESVIVTREKETRYASEISAALQNREFEIYLQPKIDLQSGRVGGAEALIRWNHPEDGFLPPGVFLETVEKSNHRAEFAIFVAEETMRLCQEVHALGHEIAFSFNLSGYDVVDPIVRSKLKALAAMFEGHQCRPEIELTESETSFNVVEIKDSLNELSQLGYRIALDDFGTGMSSLSYCHELSINTVKIDKSFVDVLLKDAIGVIPIASILSLAECYGYDVVVEGVETEDQAAVLSNMGCTLCQGYYFAKPMPFSEFLAFINGKSLGMIA